VENFLFADDFIDQRRHGNGGIGQERRRHLVDLGWFKEGLITLDIDHDVICRQPQTGYGLGNPVGARTVPRRGHDCPATEALHCRKYPFIISCHGGVGERLGLHDALINMLDHGSAAKIGQGFTGKPAGMVS
jgi:hypothetical protein